MADGVAVGIIGMFLLLWLVYRYEDWRNDFFVLGKDRVIDIDRKPFGLSCNGVRLDLTRYRISRPNPLGQ